MAEALRKRGKQIVVYILMSILILSFVGWGVGDLFNRSSQDAVVAEIGSEKIYAGELMTVAVRKFEAFKSVLGLPSLQVALQMGFLSKVFDAYLNDLALDQIAARQGLVVGNDFIQKAILADDRFYEGDAFSKELFLQTLRENGYTEDQYIQILKENYERSEITQAVNAGSYIPPSMLGGTYSFLNEEREADYITFPLVKKESLTPPTDQEIEDYYQARQEQFRVPELRTFQVLMISPEKIAETVQVSDDKIKDYYNAHLTSYKQEPGLQIQVAQFKTKEEADKAMDQLKDTKDFAATAAQLTGQDKETIDLGWVSKNDLLETIATQLFTLKKDEISQPIEGIGGWQVYRIVNRRDAEHKDLSEVKSEIHKALAHETAVQEISSLSQQVDDAIGRGEKLTDIASQFKLQLLDVKDVDDRGRSQNGNSTINSEVAQAAFKLQPGEDSLLETMSDGGRFIVHMDKITPTAIQPVAEVKGEISEHLLAQKQLDTTREEIRKMMEEVKSAPSFAEWAKAKGFPVKRTEKITRLNLAQKSKEIPEIFKGRLFDRSDTGITIYDNKDHFLIGKVVSITQVKPDFDTPEALDIQSQLADSVKTDLGVLFIYAVRQELGMQFNKEVFTQVRQKLEEK